MHMVLLALALSVIPERSEIRIAVLDSGLHVKASAYRGRIVTPYDVIRQRPDPKPNHGDDHGTCVANVITSMCPTCLLMPVRMLTRSGPNRSHADAEAVRWAAEHDADVIVASWGMNDGLGFSSALLKEVHAFLHGNGRRVALFAAPRDANAKAPEDARYVDVVHDTMDPTRLYTQVPKKSVCGFDALGSPMMRPFSGSSAATAVMGGRAGKIMSLDPSVDRTGLYQRLAVVGGESNE